MHYRAELNRNVFNSDLNCSKLVFCCRSSTGRLLCSCDSANCYTKLLSPVCDSLQPCV